MDVKGGGASLFGGLSGIFFNNGKPMTALGR